MNYLLKAMHHNDKTAFLDHVQESFQSGTLIKLTLSKPAQKAAELKNLYVRPVDIKGQRRFSFKYRYQTKDIVKNHLSQEAMVLLDERLGNSFLEANLITTQADHHLLFSKKRKARLLTKQASQNEAPDTHHNKQKNRFIRTEGNPYLKALGITNSEGGVLKSGQKKFRQINKFIEIIDGLLRQHPLPENPRIVDMGSGKGYLTFALYDHLRHHLHQKAKVTGIELRQALVDFCNQLAQEARYEQLTFKAMDIVDYPVDQIDMLIALHACDIATDIAIARGIQSGAEIIIVAPCCHKQVRQCMAPTDIFGTMLKHGILLERQAELLTDSIRSLLLEAHGYHTKVFEFISTEHTPKNMMIVGMKGKEKPEALETIIELKKRFGVKEHYLEQLLSL